MTTNLIVGAGTGLDHWRNARCLADMRPIDLTRLVPDGARAVIIAPHPDDEILGCGGLLQLLHAAGRSLLLISITDGTASHPGSTAWPAERLRQVRPQESEEALTRLGLSGLNWVRGGFEDTQVATCEDAVSAFIKQHLRPGDVVFATWREDGHSDHDAVGRASSRAAKAVGATLHEVPIWAWHWAHNDDPRVPWKRARKVCLSPYAIARKRYAAQAFTSQLEQDPSTGLEAVLPAPVLERLLQPFEVVFIQE
ncbi:PIG-L deacetylase family protein [Pseudomonas saxonica]|uniref:PIG-L family deacetylase n=1 Tax=Pseudomonas saxonica TaxID=2600598 RepID=A0A5C5Q1F2_9PSED|nr:PIG-L family deacetylase [Pseudomonas saxonica]TWR86892.1 PIG-L family deacetylase [Pseudomonas saxonica]TWR98102.1 PIG-L family deacetylase [Pseudomonas saxonica]WRQ75285.1 PIG-L family deacetylase [Pseudomonas saxonica]